MAARIVAILSSVRDQARELAERALSAHPNSAEVRTNCGWAFIFEGASEAAIEHFEGSRRMNPIDPLGHRALTGLAAANFFCKRFKKAEQFATRVLETQPDNVTAMRFLIASLARQNLTDAATDVARQLLTVQPNFSIARLRLKVYRYPEMAELYAGALRMAGLPE